MIVIGIDPDSKAHGYAEYIDGRLKKLESLSTVDIVQAVEPLDKDKVLFSIENVCANNFIYSRNDKGGKSIVQSIARKLGMVQQSQIELMRWLDWLEIKYELHKPQRGNWANDKRRFENATGWTKRSNEDTRSAAYFGYLAVK